MSAIIAAYLEIQRDVELLKQTSDENRTKQLNLLLSQMEKAYPYFYAFYEKADY